VESRGGRLSFQGKNMYHTFQDLLDIVTERDLRQLADDDNVGDPILQDPPNALMQRISSQGDRAQRFIDGMVRGRYQVPLSPVPDMIREVSASLTVYYMYERREDRQPAEATQMRYKNALELLRHVQDGKIELYDRSAPTPSYRTNKTDEDRIFTSNELEKF
jgi:phage gp36-like protein